jgi:hypothetical protein
MVSSACWNGNKCSLPSPERVRWDLFIGVVRGSVTISEHDPHICPIYTEYIIMRALQPFYALNYFIQDLFTRWHVSLLVGSSFGALLRPSTHRWVLFPRPARNYKIRRLVHESMHMEIITPDGAEGAFDAWPRTCIPSSSAKLSAHDDAEGAFRWGLRASSPTGFYEYASIVTSKTPTWCKK